MKLTLAQRELLWIVVILAIVIGLAHLHYRAKVDFCKQQFPNSDPSQCAWALTK